MAERRFLTGKVPGSPYVGENVPQSNRRQKVPGSLHGGRRFLSPVDGKRFQVPQSSRREGSRFLSPVDGKGSRFPVWRREGSSVSIWTGKVPGSLYGGNKFVEILATVVLPCNDYTTAH